MTLATTPPAPVKVIKTPVFLYGQLNGTAKEAARKWLIRDVFFPDWHKPSCEDARGIIALFGFYNIEIRYSGFYSQGGGASFTAGWMRENVSETLISAIKTRAPTDEKLNAIAVRHVTWLAEWPMADWSAIQRINSKLFHENSVGVGRMDNDLPDKCEKEFMEIARELMRWICAQLKAEAEGMESEAYLADHAAANKYTFTATGERFG